jgi:UDP-N-acetylglucosamine diphosphorylase/glucosamine-1-phosphate N-acetyltransferase
MLTIVFEDAAADRLGPLTAARPACDLTIGSLTLVEALRRFGTVRRAPRPHLAAYLAALAGRRIAIWGGEPDTGPVPAPASRHGGVVLAVNARAIPSRENLATLRSLVEAGHRCVIRSGDTIAAAVLHRAGGDLPEERLPPTGDETIALVESLGLPAADVAIDMLAAAHESITAHERAIEGGLAIRLDAGGYTECRPGLFVAEGAHVADEVAVRHGPVLVEAGAEIGPFVCLDGPAWIGPDARVNPHAWIRAGTALGRACRAGGEIEATVMEPFANKPHDGFLGHSHVGSWVNLAAGTITSNLKVSYGPVRIHETGPDGGRTSVDTGRQFLGSLIGDFAKTGINASLPCGAMIGPAATVGGAVPVRVAAFANRLAGNDEGQPTTPVQAATVLERMMARRGFTLLDADRWLLEAIADPTG